ncbi:AraC family transcriptional regulator [Wenyingzhuangia sp. 2_MG-2023]|uniref:AraC family transcriptional regulator n=1 Tax=Wenyingzhuangia sp. 2_MG-2023 TaxID=3062639 RepID=UPI0026E3EE85|nr:AraC family transcriptional regulator [Wenyingzhuangia sp. 2_MG-2023]MDO6736577.1 AraC family transcriptional regulator [Wenyingzhuangia sp. 2_MG-2023]
MKAIKQQISQQANQSFTVSEFEKPYFDSPWHFHTEYELTYVHKGYGTRFVGASAELFQEGDMVLIGTCVPHYWRCDEDHYQDNGLSAHSIVIQFKPELFFHTELPEMDAIRLLLKKSASGVAFQFSKTYQDTFFAILKKTGFEQLMEFYNLLHQMSKDKSQRLLSISFDSQLYQAKDSKIFQEVINYIFTHFKDEISLIKVSEKVHMSTPAFCRYFKKRTQKTFTEYVNNLRIAQASKLLIETDMSISQICFECGYNSLSYFNRQFKKHKKIGPKEYKKLHIIS